MNDHKKSDLQKRLRENLLRRKNRQKNIEQIEIKHDEDVNEQERKESSDKSES
jgi:hypothetical protein